MHTIVRHAAALSAALAACALAHGQSAGQLERELQRPPEPVSRKGIQIERRLPAQPLPAGAAEARFVLGALELQGNRALPTEALQPLWQAQLGREMTVAAAFELAQAITARYRAAGYVLSQAVVPVQQLSTDAPATLRIDVLEGFIEKASASGTAAAEATAYLGPVTAERPLRLATLERALLLVNELPGLQAQAVLRAGSTAAASELELALQQRPYAFSASVHNRVAKSQGPVRVDLSAVVNGLFGHGDQHSLRLVTSANERTNFASYAGDAALGSSGLRANWSVSYARSAPDVGVPVVSPGTYLSAGGSYAALRSRQSNVTVRASVMRSDSRSDVAGLSVSDDRLLLLHAGLTADYADAFSGINILDLDLAKGLGHGHASDPLTSTSSARAAVYLARLQSLGGAWSALLAASGQYAGSRLPSSELFGIGGDTFLRAYDPSEATGERGVAAKLELRFNADLGSLPGTVYAYYDRGRVERLNAVDGDVATTLSAAGLGLRLSGPTGLRGFVELAKPLDKVVTSTGDRSWRLFAGIGIDF